jgi:hypothetical protein
MTLFPKDTRPDLPRSVTKVHSARNDEARRCIRQARRAKAARRWAWMD